MGRFNNRPLAECIQEVLEWEYAQALTYAVQYDSGWERAERAFTRLQAFKLGLRERTVEAAALTAEQQRKAA